MTASVSQVHVNDQIQMNAAINGYVAQGFVVANQTPYSTTMIKRKQFSALWAVIGFLLCLLPLLIYLVVYAAQSDQMVEIRLSTGVGASTGPNLSPDGNHWWDGTTWQDARITAPSTAQRSQDGMYWWDGAAWRPVPSAGGSAAPSMPPPPPDTTGGPSDAE
jgi:hypothetical protein